MSPHIHGHYVGKREFTVKVRDLLDCGVDVAVAIQRVGELIVGGPGCSHGVSRFVGPLYFRRICIFRFQ